MRYAIGFDIGGTKLAVCLAAEENGNITILDKVQSPTPKGANASIGVLMKNMNLLLQRSEVKKKELCGIGISCGGPLDSQRGIILSPPNLPGWDEIPITTDIEKCCGVPAYIQNDADACALAEWKYGAGKGMDNVVFLTFGTGLGAGLILNGRLYTGTCNMAGEIGHCRAPLISGAAYSPVGYGKGGSFEGFCSGGGIAQLGRLVAMERLQLGQPATFCPTWDGLDHLSAKTIAEAADAGDPIAKRVYWICGKYLGAALAWIIDFLNPEAVIIGSIYVRSEGLLRQAMQEEIEREALPQSAGVCRIIPAALGENLGDIAAASVAFSHIESDKTVRS